MGWLSTEAQERGCCRVGHNFTNMCQGGAGTSYILDTLNSDSQLANADLILIDTAPNDMNMFVYSFLKHTKVGEEEHETAGALTETLVRVLLGRTQAALFYVATAWFVDGKGKTLTQNAFGAWKAQEPVLRHYGVPALHMPSVLDEEHERGAAGMSHNHWYVDPPHYSLEAHTMQAYFLGRALQECAQSGAMSGASHPIQRPLGPAPLTELPRLLYSESRAMQRLVGSARTLIDFTDPAARFRPMLRVVDGWRWVQSRKDENGSYRHHTLSPETPPLSTSSQAAASKV